MRSWGGSAKRTNDGVSLGAKVKAMQAIGQQVNGVNGIFAWDISKINSTAGSVHRTVFSQGTIEFQCVDLGKAGTVGTGNIQEAFSASHTCKGRDTRRQGDVGDNSCIASCGIDAHEIACTCAVTIKCGVIGTNKVTRKELVRSISDYLVRGWDREIFPSY